MRAHSRAACATLVSVIVVACGANSAGPPATGVPDATTGHVDAAAADDASAGDAHDASPPSEWLAVQGNQILTGDGKPFHGRGANLHDTRSCNACTSLPEDATLVAEVKRRADELTGAWHANFVRLDLEAYAADDGYRKQYKGILDDPTYLANTKAIVTHLASKPGVYVLLSDWTDPTISVVEWPTAATRQVWTKLAKTFKDEPRVLFGLVNEPHDDPSKNDQLWTAMNDTVQAIRDAEKKAGGRQHLVVVQGTHEYARHVDYYVTHPITAGGGTNIAYEVHVYNPTKDFDAMFIQPSKSIPVIIGEYGPFTAPPMTIADITNMMNAAEQAGVPYMAWSFHQRCPPNLYEDVPGGGCGIGVPMKPTAPFGELVKARLAQPW